MVTILGCSDDAPVETSGGDEGVVSNDDPHTNILIDEGAPVRDGPIVDIRSILGRVRYEDRLFDADGFTGERPLRPARRIEVSVLDDDRRIATKLTAEAGACMS